MKREANSSMKIISEQWFLEQKAVLVKAKDWMILLSGASIILLLGTGALNPRMECSEQGNKDLCEYKLLR